MSRLLQLLRRAAAGLATLGLLAGAAHAADPIKIGFSMALSGGLAANGKAALLAIQMWADDVNAKGGLLGRKVQLVNYDDQSNPANVPGLYTKLIDVDKVDLIVSPYGTNLIAPAMPVAMQKGRTMMSLFGVGVNEQFNYDRYFQIMPVGVHSGEAIPEGFFAAAKALNPKPQSVALVGADAEFGKITVDAARKMAKAMGLKIVYDRAYPPSTVDFTPVARAIQATKPDLIFIAAYPPDSVGIIRSLNEIGANAMLIGGGSAGPQFASIKTQLGPLLNNLLGYELYVPSPKLKFPGVEDFLKRYQAKAVGQGIDPLGFYVPPFIYAAMDILGQAVEKTGSLDQAALAKTLHAETFSSVVGNVRFAKNGEWEKPRVLMVQYRNVDGSGVDQFRDPGRYTILFPPEFKSGEAVVPYRKE
ncbi:amino acid ABC transporter substrate-binding protein [Pseudolabrys taiwanensis]|nr:amino acid ABC transporter substrate-binding protein [Pseudolabrys taiwanensis]